MAQTARGPKQGVESGAGVGVWVLARNQRLWLRAHMSDADFCVILLQSIWLLCHLVYN